MSYLSYPVEANVVLSCVATASVELMVTTVTNCRVQGSWYECMSALRPRRIGNLDLACGGPGDYDSGVSRG